MCDIGVFLDTLSTLDSAWSTISSRIAVPQKTGLSFGNCETCCGSIGIVGVRDLNLDIDTSAIACNAAFTLCGKRDEAILVVPVNVIPVNFDIHLRATGIGATWPSNMNQDFVHTHGARIGGNIIITVPFDRYFRFQEPVIDFQLFGHWFETTDTATHWPDNTNPIFNNVPVEELLINYMSNLNETIKKGVEKMIFNAVQKHNVNKTCSTSTPALATCRAATVYSPSSCDPCDTCCKCMMLQSCDGDCAACPCVKCTSRGNDLLLYITAFIMGLALIVLYYNFDKII